MQHPSNGYATPPGPGSSSTYDSSISNSASDPGVREVLGVYPFMQYTPSSRVAKHLSSLTITHPAIPPLEEQHPDHARDFARLDNPVEEKDWAYWAANRREAERLMVQYGIGIGGGAARGSGLGGSIAGVGQTSRAQHRHPEIAYNNYPASPIRASLWSSSNPAPPKPNMAESFLGHVVPPVSTPFGHPIPVEHYYVQPQASSSSTPSNGASRPSAMAFLNRYVEEMTDQRITQARVEQEQQQQQQRQQQQPRPRTPSRVDVNSHGLPVRSLPKSTRVSASARNQAASRTPSMQASNPANSAQQILDGLQQMSQPHASSNHNRSLPPPAVTATSRRLQLQTPAHTGFLDQDTADSSPSKGRARAPISARKSGPVTDYDTPETSSTVLPPIPVPVLKPQPQSQPMEVDEFRSPEVSDGEEREDTDEDAEGENDEDVYTPGGSGKVNGVVLDSGRPEKPTARIVTVGAIRSSVRPASSKIDHVRRFKDLVDQIFQAENATPASVRESDVLRGTRYFARTRKAEDGTTRLVLSSETLENLATLSVKALPRSRRKAGGIDKSSSGIGISGTRDTPMTSAAKSAVRSQASGELRDWDNDDIGRLFRILERNMMDAQNINIFRDDHYDRQKAGLNTSSSAVTTPSPTKGGKPTKKKAKQSPAKAKGFKVELDATKVDRVHRDLQTLGEGLMAAGICLCILSTSQLPKQLYSEDLLITSMDTVKKAVEHAILPFVEALTNPQGTIVGILLVTYADVLITIRLSQLAISSHTLAYIIGSLNSDQTARLESQLAKLIVDSSSCLTYLANLVLGVTFSLPDSMVFKMSSLAIQIVFSTELPEGKDATAIVKAGVNVLGGRAGLKSFKAGAMSLLKALFPRQSSEQRDHIIEEILSSVFKLAELKKAQTHIRLRNGQSIHFISALLLELLQSCAYSVKYDIDNIRRKASLQTITTDDNESLLPSTQAEEARVYRKAIELIEKSSFAVANYMLRKSTVVSTGRGGRSVSDNDYRALFETYLQNQLTVLYMPEWPVAALSLAVTAKLMMRALEETRSSPEITIGRAIAIEHLGALATRLRSFTVEQKDDMETIPKPIQQIIASLDSEAWRKLDMNDQAVNGWLAKRSHADVLCQHAIQLNIAQRGLEIHQAMQRSSTEDAEEMTVDKSQRVEEMLKLLKSDYSNINRETDDDSLFDPESLEEAKIAYAASCRLQSVRSLQSAYPIILNSILATMHASVVAQRTKAVRALGALITVDPDVLLDTEIKISLQDRFADSSPAVRDAVVDLVGKYILLKPDVANEYYPLISARVTDTGLGVRKRVIKLLKGVYAIIDKPAYRIDTCCRLVETLPEFKKFQQDLAIAALADIWFGTLKPSTRTGDTPHRSTSETDSDLRDAAQIIVATLKRFGDSPGPIAEVIEQIAKNKTMLDKYAELVDVMLESLLENSGRSVTDTLHLVQAIHLLSRAIPQIITVAKATALLPYLRPASSPDQVALTETLLRMLRISIPHMPRTSLTFAQDLSKLLLPMIGRPGGKLSTLEETVACYCVVVRHITEEYVRVASILTSCVTKLQSYQDARYAGKETSSQDQKSIPFFIIISSLMVSSCNLDKVKAEKDEVFTILAKWCQGSVKQYVYELLLNLWELNSDSGLRNAIIQGLSVIFRAYPTMMIEDTSTTLMDQCFSTDATSPETVLRMLTLLYECLSTDKEEVEPYDKSNRGEKELGNGNIDITKLIGNTSNFAESGVNSAIVQRYLQKILESALSIYADIQKVAMDILALTIDQGLAHPIQSVPVLISLETSESEAISEKAFGLHSILQNKHASIINSRYLESVRMAFRYRQTLDLPVSGHRGGSPAIAVLDRWYSLVKEKRVWKQDFLKQMCRAFDFDGSQPDISTAAVQLQVFIADNLALLDYRNMEEVFQVLQQMKQLLSVSGQQVLYNLPKIEAEDESVPIEEGVVAEEDTSLYQGDEAIPSEDLRRAGLTIGVALLLRARLKKTYGLSEDKCITVSVGIKKTAAADKPAHKKIDAVGNIIEWDTLPAILQGMKTVAEYNRFREALIHLAEQDGSIEVNDDEEMDEDDPKDGDY
ncbi:hypothetical protein QFC22_001270 [Naganishia vaughanmartiniae]|uniref:Uncharacterized protein n=1 Tax=Naganishia vaughanmartiniae TaxID=1424756 RepID=A0ACC2XHK1_9TREE|nr:hypothetical protein QFC22_001270 [Naganishia vaughanmartiniae]